MNTVVWVFDIFFSKFID